MECLINKPYPTIRVERPNIKYANLLLDDYAGSKSELTSITQYVYQDFDKFNTFTNLSETLSQIAMVEMKHLELLGKTIKLLGLNPELVFPSFPTRSYTYWDSHYVNYTTDIVSMLQSDIEIERIAIKNYLYHISIIEDKYIRALLYRIIEDEERHIECFQSLLQETRSFKNNC